MKAGIFGLIACIAFATGEAPCTDTNNAAECATSACSAVLLQPNAQYASVTITAGSKRFTYVDAPITPSDFTVREEIELRKINAPLAEKIEYADGLLQKGAGYKAALGVSFPLLSRTVDEVAQYLLVPAVDARVEYRGGRFTVTADREGRALDENKLYAAIYYCFKFGGGSVKAHTVPVMPEVTRRELSEALVLRGEYTTDYAASSEGRAHNVTLALKKFDGVKIAAGETLSFNATVGARTVENGFKTAKIIVDGKYVDGVGGGVCQSSTAVYNAALTAGLVCTANAHSICPSYCPAGLDAMISSVSDLTITNPTEHDVYISVKTGGGRATVRMYGERSEYEIVPKSEVKTVAFPSVEVIDGEHKYFGDGAVSGDRMLVNPGKDGAESVTYLEYYKDGNFVKREKIRQNEYKSMPQVIAVAP